MNNHRVNIHLPTRSRISAAVDITVLLARGDARAWWAPDGQDWSLVNNAMIKFPSEAARAGESLLSSP
jgi:hypothetical protein